MHEGPGKTRNYDQHRIAEYMAVKYLPLGVALGAGGEHVLLAISSRNEFLVSSVIVANALSPIDTTGNTRCQK